MDILDNIDRAILNRIQSDFPITSRPFLEIAKDLEIDEIDEDEVIRRVVRLKKIGVIRRIGGSFVPDRLGFTSTLCAAHVPDERMGQFVEVVNRYPGVTHNYRRSHTYYNVWFTFISESREKIEACLNKIKEDTGVTDILDLPATRVYKIKAQFDL
nr:Lrp/AsnC family transcriptional regulator [Desulfobacterales bacterium]